jgi:transposase
VDEKPGLQALANTAPDRPPVARQHPAVRRDHEYRRPGTCSILAALDLHDGHVTARVERRHRSREFIALLKDLDTRYPADCTIRLVPDNHSAHISKETRAFLATRPNRFQYALTPKHGSWLNIVETLFGKMARTFLRHIRVQSWAELRQRILQGDCGNQCRAGCASLEKIRCFETSQSGNILVKLHTGNAQTMKT